MTEDGCNKARSLVKVTHGCCNRWLSSLYDVDELQVDGDNLALF